MRNLIIAAAFAAAVLAAPPAARAATTAPAVLTTPAPIRVGVLTAYKYGSGPKTLVLVPGLASGAYVWDSTVAALQSKYTIYTVTFDGFDGMPAAKGPYMDAFTKSVEDLIRTQNLHKPIVVGHSAGGVVALRVGIEDSAAISGVVAVDSLPIYPPLRPGETLQSRQAVAAQMTSDIMGSSPSAYAAVSRQTIGSMVTSPSDADMINERSLKSDRATVAGVAGDLATTDLTPQLSKITVPVLVLAAAAQYGPEPTKQFYEAQYKASNVKVVPIANARHFIMYDQPEAFRSALTGFADGLKN